MIFLAQTKNAKEEVLAIDESDIRMITMEIKSVNGKNKRAWTLTFKDNTTFVPEDNVKILRESVDVFSETIGDMAKHLNA